MLFIKKSKKVISVKFNVLTVIPYLIFAFQGITSPIIGVMLLDIAKKFGVDSAAIGFCFTLWIAGGGLAGIFSGRILAAKGNRFTIFLCLFLILLSTAGILSPALTLFSIGMFISGVGTFLLVAIANCLIVQQYTGESRTSQFNLLNFFYSTGALITPATVGYFLDKGVNWETLYLFPFILLLPILLLTLSPAVKKSDEALVQNTYNQKSIQPEISFGVYLVSIAIGFYCITELAFTQWIVVYLRETLAVEIIPAALVLTTFYICQAAGRLASGFIVKYVALEKFIFGCCLLALAAMSAILAVTSYQPILLITGILALGLASIYPSILSYGTLHLPSSPQVVTYIMSGGTIACILGMPLSSFLKQNFGSYACLQLSLISIIFVILFVALTKWTIKVSTVKNNASTSLE
jgi:TsgA-like MFS transporter